MADKRTRYQAETTLLLLMALGMVGGCALEPKGIDAERSRAQAAAQPYEQPFEERKLPVLSAQPDWRGVLQRAFLANGELESAFFAWQAALSRVEIASAYPNTRVMVGFDYMFSAENMKAWDRTTLSVGFDPMMMLQFPTKVAQAGKVALAEAQAAGERFRAAKFTLQQNVLVAWSNYALAAEKLRIQREQIELLSMLVDTAAQRVRSGGAQPDLLKAQTEYELAQNELANLESELRAMRAMLNGMLARPADAPLDPPTHLPEPRAIPADDATLITAAVDQNPELAALAHEVAGRADSVELARLAYIPDLAPQFSITGSVSQAVGAMVALPTTLRQIRASIDEARALLRSTEAMARQTRSDRAAQFVVTLVALRNHERQIDLFERSILTNVEQVYTGSQRAYAVGAASFAGLIDSQRMLLEVRLLAAEAGAAREQRLAELERLAGLDIETLAGANALSPSQEIHRD